MSDDKNGFPVCAAEPTFSTPLLAVGGMLLTAKTTPRTICAGSNTLAASEAVAAAAAGAGAVFLASASGSDGKVKHHRRIFFFLFFLPVLCFFFCVCLSLAVTDRHSQSAVRGAAAWFPRRISFAASCIAAYAPPTPILG